MNVTQSLGVQFSRPHQRSLNFPILEVEALLPRLKHLIHVAFGRGLTLYVWAGWWRGRARCTRTTNQGDKN